MRDPLPPDENSAADAELENELRALFRREDAPAGLTERVLSRAGGPHASPRRAMLPADWLRRCKPVLGLCAVLIAVCAFVTVGVVRRQRIEARQAQQARARLLYALQLTARELDWAEMKVNQDMARPSGAPARSAHAPKTAERL